MKETSQICSSIFLAPKFTFCRLPRILPNEAIEPTLLSVDVGYYGAAYTSTGSIAEKSSNTTLSGP